MSLTEEGHTGQTYDIVSPLTISGPGNGGKIEMDMFTDSRRTNDYESAQH